MTAKKKKTKVAKAKPTKLALGPSVLANELLSLRQKRKLTQLAVAEELGYGTAQFVSNWERGISAPPLASVAKLAPLLGIGRDALLSLLFKQRAADLAEERFAAFAKYGVKA